MSKRLALGRAWDISGRTIMRGFLQPSVRPLVTDSQRAFGALSRHRRTKLARAAQTTLLKADQWARGEAVSQEIAGGLEGGVQGLKSLKKK